MRCPWCGHLEDRVVDSREAQDGQATRRRRECLGCARRFTTYERIEDLFPMVVKRDGRRENFDRLKIITGIQKACQKRPVSVDAIEQAVVRIERVILDTGEREIACTRIGDEVQAELRALDPVAWLRFMSVYLGFKTIEDFRAAMDELAPGDGD